jgi:hypothetical protein
MAKPGGRPLARLPVSSPEHVAHTQCRVGAARRVGRLAPVLTQRSTAKMAYIHAPTSSGTAKSASGVLPSIAPPIIQASAAGTPTRQSALNVKFHEFIGFPPFGFAPKRIRQAVRGILGSTVAKIDLLDGWTSDACDSPAPVSVGMPIPHGIPSSPTLACVRKGYPVA